MLLWMYSNGISRPAAAKQQLNNNERTSSFTLPLHSNDIVDDGPTVWHNFGTFEVHTLKKNKHLAYLRLSTFKKGWKKSIGNCSSICPIYSLVSIFMSFRRRNLLSNRMTYLYQLRSKINHILCEFNTLVFLCVFLSCNVECLRYGYKIMSVYVSYMVSC